ncbi:MAG: hypothetical protein QNJ00_06640 [Woeseiaceae bacterium]|nr:hypothetical protein [Woeseiaceae bacterium]
MNRVIATAVLLALGFSAHAEGPSYNYVEGFYQRINLDSGFVDVDGDGFAIGGSFEFGTMWQAFASYSMTDFDFNVDLDEFAIGAGFHSGLSATSDFFLNLAYLRADASFGFLSADDDGYGIAIGVRSFVTPELELNASVGYVDFGDGDDYTFTGQGWYSVTERFAVGLTLGFADDVTRFGIGSRFYFGQ